MIRTSILSISLITLLTACGGEQKPQVEVNPCNCFEAMEHGEKELASIIEACNTELKSDDFKKEYQRCKLADMRGVSVDDIQIPDPVETERPLLDLPTSGTYTLDTDVSKVQWAGSKITGDTHRGVINVSSGSITLDGNVLQNGKAIIDMTSLSDLDIDDDAERAKLEGHLKSADFFAVDEHPNAVFEFDTPVTLEDFRGEVNGKLTIRGISKEVQAPVTIVGTSNGSMILSGAMVIDRTEFNVKFGSSAAADFIIKDEFTINFSFHGSPVQ